MSTFLKRVFQYIFFWVCVCIVIGWIVTAVQLINGEFRNIKALRFFAFVGYVTTGILIFHFGKQWLRKLF